MPDKIKPSEVSEVLFRELQDIQDDIQYEEVGKVLQVSDGTARIYGLKNATADIGSSTTNRQAWKRVCARYASPEKVLSLLRLRGVGVGRKVG